MPAYGCTGPLRSFGDLSLPRYDYECEAGHSFELKQSFVSEPVADCPICGIVASRKFSAVPIVFKGSGWYVNDYGKKGSSSTSTASRDDGDSAKAEKSSTKDGAKAEAPAKSAAKEKAGTKSGD